MVSMSKLLSSQDILDNKKFQNELSTEEPLTYYNKWPEMKA